MPPTDHGERLVKIETELGPLKQGVENFRRFQEEGRKFFEESRAFQQRVEIQNTDQMKYQEALARALSEREKKADRWWKRILTWVLIVGGLIGLSQYVAPLVRHWLGIPVATADSPKAQSEATPELSHIP